MKRAALLLAVSAGVLGAPALYAQTIGQQNGILGGEEGFFRPSTVPIPSPATIDALPRDRMIIYPGSYTFTATTDAPAISWRASPLGTTDACTLIATRVAAWRMDEASGDFVDRVGGRDLTRTGAVTSVTGQVGNAASFTRTAPPTQYAEWADVDDGLDFVGTSFTVAFWLKPGLLSTDQALVYKVDGGGFSAKGWGVYQKSNDKITASINGYYLDSTTSVSLGTWIHYAIVATGTGVQTFKIYVNGVEEGASGAFGTPAAVQASTRALDIAAWNAVPANPPDTSGFTGVIDDIQLWTSALSADNIAMIYARGAGGVESMASDFGCAVALRPTSSSQAVETITIGSDSVTTAWLYYPTTITASNFYPYAAQNLDEDWSQTYANNDPIATIKAVNPLALDTYDLVQGTGSAQPKWVADVGGQPAIYCDGGDKASTTEAAAWGVLNSTSNDWTIDALVSWDLLGGGVIASTDDGAGGDGMSVSIDDFSGYALATMVDGAESISASTSSFGASILDLNSLSVIHDDVSGAGADLTVKINVTDVGTGAQTGTLAGNSPARPFTLCADAAGNNHTGYIFDLLLYPTTALTADQLAINNAAREWAYNATIPVTP